MIQNRWMASLKVMIQVGCRSGALGVCLVVVDLNSVVWFDLEFCERL